MTAPPVTRTGGWIGFQGEAATPAAATDLINVLAAVDVPIVVLRRDFLIACFNQAAADLLGLGAPDVGRPARAVPALAGLPLLEERCSQVLADGAETRADCRAGDKSFVVRIAPYSARPPQVTGIVLTFTNVTALRASIDQAVYEREFIKAIINTVADPLVVLGAGQRIQTGNRAFYTMFGVSREAIQGVPLARLGSGAFARVALRRQLDELLAGGRAFHAVEVDQVETAAGRRTLLLDARPVAFPDHAEHRVLLTFQDITARKQAEAAKDLRSEAELRRSEAFLVEGQRLSLTGSFCWNAATGAITWSEQLYRIYELESGTPVTLRLIRTRVHPDDQSLLERVVDEARRGRSDFEWQYRLLMPDGAIKYLHAVARATQDRKGQLEYIAAVQDVTARHLSDEALARARSELAKVARVTSLGVLTAALAHEVNQPLAGIITNASTCLRMLSADPPNVEGARETARRTIRDGNRASDVITRLRRLYTRKDLSPEWIDLNAATREVTALLLSELRRNRVILRLELADCLPDVSADRIQLQQVILNLLRNASEAMNTVEDRPRELLVRTGRDAGGQVRLSVSDTGPGFTGSAADKLFEAFYTTKPDGMGIGLSISRSIIDAHLGRLWATPNDGPGATFAFVVPGRPGPADAPAEVPE